MTENDRSAGEMVLTVSADEGGIRMDVWLKQRVESFSRKIAQRHCQQGRVRQNGRIVGKADLAIAGATVSINPSLNDAAVPAPELELDVRIETEDLVVANKPAGVPSAAVYGRTEGTLAGALLCRYPEMANVGFGPRDPGLLHRLDTYTSGLIIAARNQRAFSELRNALQTRAWDKRYLAIVESSTLPDSGECRLGLLPDPKSRRKVKVDERKGQACCSTYVVLKRGAHFDLVEVRASSAYRHQVRVHMAALGAPLIGDELYGGPNCGLAPRHALHASYIAIPTAGLGPVSCDLPDDLRALLCDGD